MLRPLPVALALLLASLALAPGRAAASTTSATLPADTLTRYERQQSWFSRDKAYHFGISAAGSAGVYALAREMGLGRWPAALASAVVVGGVGVLREVVSPRPGDRLTRQFFSRRDLVWDGAGIVVGITLTDLLLRARWTGAEDGRRGTPP